MPDPVDDGSVGNDEVLWRRVFKNWVEPDENGQPRTRSLAFLDRRSGKISVHRSHLTTEAFVLRNHPTHGMVALLARSPRSNGYPVAADPVQDEPGQDDDPSHALLLPPKGAGQSRLKTLAKVLARASKVIRPPVGWDQPANDGPAHDPISDPE
jgi:hypothetical protein